MEYTMTRKEAKTFLADQANRYWAGEISWSDYKAIEIKYTPLDLTAYVKHTNDRHYMWRQRMSWSNGVTNYLGGLPKGGFRRQNVKWINEVLKDYTEVIR